MVALYTWLVEFISSEISGGDNFGIDVCTVSVAIRDGYHLWHCVLFCFKLDKSAVETMEMIEFAWCENAVRYKRVRE